MAGHADEDIALFTKHLVPLFEALQFEPAKWPEKPEVGELIRCMSRRVSKGRALFFVMWRKRLGVPYFGFYLYEKKKLTQLPINLALSDEMTLREYRSVYGITPDQVFAFTTACVVVAVWSAAILLPELDGAYTLDESWGRRVSAAKSAWERRYVRGEVDPSTKPATVVFRSATMILLAWADQRTTFKLETRDVPTDGLTVGDFFTSPAGTRTPLTLRGGAKTWRFDYDGKFVETV